MVMLSRSTSAPVPQGQYVPTADQRVFLWNRTWADYKALLAIRGVKAQPRMAFLAGVIELMSTSRDHEAIKSCIGCLIEGFCFERDVAFSPYGNWTQLSEPDEVALEPDECYVFGPSPKSKDRPDLAIEVVWTSGGIDKLEIYRRIGIDEVWYWEDDHIRVYGLVAGTYQLRPASAWLPELDLDLVCRLVQVEPVSEAVKQLRAAVRR
jgi:Uma2 family endonuclease